MKARPFVLLLVLASIASAQRIAFGVKGGVALTDAYNNAIDAAASGTLQTFSDTKDYAVGPMIEMRLPFGLGAEADALFRPDTLRLKQTTQISPLTMTGSGTATSLAFSTIGSSDVHTWEFPILAKYKLPIPILKPYIAAGPSFRASGEDELSSKGFTISTGIDLKALVLHVMPELRYTRWSTIGVTNRGVYPVQPNPNQVELLIGFSF